MHTIIIANFLNDHLKRLSYGSARIVYILDNSRVLKLAKNKKGLVQNRKEYDLYDNGNEILAKILRSDEKYFWIIVEKADVINESEFEKITGLNYECYCDYLTYIRRKIDPRKYMNLGNKLDEIIITQMINHTFVSKLVDFIKVSDIDIKDLYKVSSYGLTYRENEEKIVLIDYGITNEIYFKYYKNYEKRLLR